MKHPLPRPAAVLFDLDGTLVDSVADLTVSANATLAEYGLPALGEKEVASYIGDGARRLLERCLHSVGADADVSEALRSFRQHYLGQCTTLTRPYPGVEGGLSRMEDAARAIVTNKPQPMADRIADALELRPHLGAVVGARPRVPVKPEARLLEIALHELGMEDFSPSRIWMVGDSRNDVLAGRRLGLTTIAVTWGFTPRDQVARLGADGIVDSFEELLDLYAQS